MQNTEIQLNSRRNSQASFACGLLCVILFIVLGILPKIPSSITRLLRPAFIAISVITLSRCRYYNLGATKCHVVSLVYYTLIFFSHAITSKTIDAYVSIMLFILFFVFVANRNWSRREIVLILFTIVIACDVQSTILLYSNPGMLRNSSSQHLDFLGAVLNRNASAFAVTPGAICAMFLLLYDKHRRGYTKIAFFAISCLLCSFTIFAIGCRSAFASAAVGLFCVIWQKTKESNNYQERFGQRLLTVVLVLVVFFSAMYVSRGTYSSRLFDFGGGGSGRESLWEEAWELIDEKPIFGGGFDYWESTGHRMGTHNAFLTTMVSSGWIGGILLGLFFLLTLIEIMQTHNLIPLGFIAELLLHSWTEPGMDYYAYIPLMLAFILTRYIQYKNKKLDSIFIKN